MQTPTKWPTLIRPEYSPVPEGPDPRLQVEKLRVTATRKTRKIAILRPVARLRESVVLIFFIQLRGKPTRQCERRVMFSIDAKACQPCVEAVQTIQGIRHQ